MARLVINSEDFTEKLRLFEMKCKELRRLVLRPEC